MADHASDAAVAKLRPELRALALEHIAGELEFQARAEHWAERLFRGHGFLPVDVDELAGARAVALNLAGELRLRAISLREGGGSGG